MPGRLLDYIGQGDYAARPDPVDVPTLIATGAIAFHFASDTHVLSVYNADDEAWEEINLATLVHEFLLLSDVDASTPPTDGQLFKWDAGSSKLVPFTLASILGTEEIQDIIGAMFTDGSGITTSYDDATGTILITCDLTQYTDEQVRDVIGIALQQGAGITITVNDAGDQITIASSITQYTNEMAQDAVFGVIGAGDGLSAVYDDAGNAYGIKVVGATIHTTQTASFTADLTMANRWIPCDLATPMVVTLPKDATVAFPVGTTLTFDHLNTGTVTFAAEFGATVNSRGGVLATGGRYAVAQAKKVAANTWRLLGDLA